MLVVCEVQKGKDMKVSVPFRSATLDTCVELVSSCPVVCQFVPMQCPICIVIARNTRISASVTSVKVVTVVSVSLNHQLCNTFCKIQHETLSGLSRHLYVAFHCLFSPWRPL